MKLSVIICSYNPRADYLQRTLDGLRSQSLPMNKWELIVVDNHSIPALEGRFELGWHPSARIVVEKKPGLTSARLRGIADATGDIIVFVDDDNVLASDYLSSVVAIWQNNPQIAVFGGSIRAEFEVSEPEWIGLFLPYLAVSEIEVPIWSNSKSIVESLPSGAGLCILRTAASHYVSEVQNSKGRQKLGRVGNNLTSCEDTDLVYSVIDQGYGAGRFPQLKLIHLISKERLQLSYLLRLSEGIAYSGLMLKSLHGISCDVPEASNLRRILGKVRRYLFWPKIKRLKFEAGMAGARRAIKELESLRAKPSCR